MATFGNMRLKHSAGEGETAALTVQPDHSIGRLKEAFGLLSFSPRAPHQ